MEDVLHVYQLPYDPDYPLVCMDETNKQLIGEVQAQSVLSSFLYPAMPTMVPMERAALSLGETGNPRCK